MRGEVQLPKMRATMTRMTGSLHQQQLAIFSQLLHIECYVRFLVISLCSLSFLRMNQETFLSLRL